MLMNVILIHAMLMLPVLTLLVLSTVPATMDLQEMELVVKVTTSYEDVS